MRTAIKFLILVMILGCKTPRTTKESENLEYTFSKDDYVEKEYFDRLKESSRSINMDSLWANTSDFFKIEVSSNPQKKVFDLKEKKTFSMQITNYGTKALYTPEWFRTNKKYADTEMNIEIYRKEKQEFKKYVQKNLTTQTLIHPRVNSTKRIIYETSKGKHIMYENIPIDIYKKIVDKGFYKAIIHLDLSSFGYFKTLESEFFFEVK